MSLPAGVLAEPARGGPGGRGGARGGRPADRARAPACATSARRSRTRSRAAAAASPSPRSPRATRSPPTTAPSPEDETVYADGRPGQARHRRARRRLGGGHRAHRERRRSAREPAVRGGRARRARVRHRHRRARRRRAHASPQAIESTRRAATACGRCRTSAATASARWTVHCPPAIPNVADGTADRARWPDAVVAIEPFATDGTGEVVERGTRRGLPPRPAARPTGRGRCRRCMAAIRAFNGLPFARRQLARFPRAAVEETLRALRAAGHARRLSAAGGGAAAEGGAGRAHAVPRARRCGGADAVGAGHGRAGQRSATAWAPARPRRGGRRAGAGARARCRRCPGRSASPWRSILTLVSLQLDPLGRLLPGALLPRDLFLPLRESRSSSICHD